MMYTSQGFILTSILVSNVGDYAVYKHRIPTKLTTMLSGCHALGSEMRVCKLSLLSWAAVILKEQRKKKRFGALARKGPGELAPPVPFQA